MLTVLAILSAFGSIIWLSILLLPWRPWSTRERLDANQNSDSEVDLGSVTVLVPARNESETIGKTLLALNDQGKNLNIILIDDQSNDGTTDIALRSSQQNLRVLKGQALQEGWAGKLWALQQGFVEVKTPVVLLLDADIQLSPGTIAALKNKMEMENLDFVSLMAHLRMQTLWEKLLIPSFIYFFKLLYPFALGNSPRSRFAVAAGGCVLLKKQVLDSIGGFASLRGALIDDCTLAQKVKSAGFRTWIGLTHSAQSHRDYPDLKSIWNMVARSAFTQLRYSNILLLLCTLIMCSMFWMPALGLIFISAEKLKWLCTLGLGAMFFSYLPTLLFYRRSPLWLLAMPLFGTLYLLMTWTSALRYWLGRRSEWKGRVYSSKAEIGL